MAKRSQHTVLPKGKFIKEGLRNVYLKVFVFFYRRSLLGVGGGGEGERASPPFLLFFFFLIRVLSYNLIGGLRRKDCYLESECCCKPVNV